MTDTADVMLIYGPGEVVTGTVDTSILKEEPPGHASRNAYVIFRAFKDYWKEIGTDKAASQAGFREWLPRETTVEDPANIDRCVGFIGMAAQFAGLKMSLGTIYVAMFALIVGKEHRALPQLHDDFCGWSRINDGCWLSVEDFRAEWDRVRKIVELCREGDAEVRARSH